MCQVVTMEDESSPPSGKELIYLCAVEAMLFIPQQHVLYHTRMGDPPNFLHIEGASKKKKRLPFLDFSVYITFLQFL